MTADEAISARDKHLFPGNSHNINAPIAFDTDYEAEPDETDAASVA